MSASLSGLVSSINASLSKISARIDTAQSLAEAAMKRPLSAKDPEVAQLRADLSAALATIHDLQSRITALEAKPAEVADVAEVTQ